MPLKLEQYIDASSLDNLTGLIEQIGEERFTAKSLGISYRVICDWSDKKLIRFGKMSDNSRRRYSFIDYIWVKVLTELRAFGVEVAILQKIAEEVYAKLPTKEIFDLLYKQQALFSELKEGKSFNLNIDDNEKREFLEFIERKEYLKADFSAIEQKVNFLYLIVADIIATKKAVSIIIFKDGDWLPYIEENKVLYSEDILYKLKFESHLSVSITNLVFSFMLEEYSTEFGNSIQLLTKQELSVLDYINKGNYKTITVYYKSKKTAPLELQKGKSTLNHMMKIFQSKAYKEFIVTDKKGNDIRIRAVKEKLPYELGVKALLKNLE